MSSGQSQNISASRHPSISCGGVAPIALKSSGVCSGQLWTQIYLECLVNEPQSEASSQVASLSPAWWRTTEEKDVFLNSMNKRAQSPRASSPVSRWLNNTPQYDVWQCIFFYFCLDWGFFFYRYYLIYHIWIKLGCIWEHKQPDGVKSRNKQSTYESTHWGISSGYCEADIHSWILSFNTSVRPWAAHGRLKPSLKAAALSFSSSL